MTKETREDRVMREALEADGEKLRQLTGQDHGPFTDMSGFMPDDPAMREAYLKDEAAGKLPSHRKARIRALLAELAELLTDDGN